MPKKQEEQKQITLDDLWNPAFNSVYNATKAFIIGRKKRGTLLRSKYDELFLQGGRASGKSTFASAFVWLSLMNDTEKNAVILRKVGSSIRKSCWKQMMKMRERLALYDWVPNLTEMTLTNNITGQQIFFVGLDDEEKVRSITVVKGYISIAWFEEAKQFKSMEEIDQAVASLLRGGADTDERDYDLMDEEGHQEYMTILTYNPPKSASDWINKEARSTVKKNRLSHKSTYLTMPKHWLGRKILSEIESMKANKRTQFEHMYLGKVTGTGGEYFTNIVVRHISDEERAAFDYENMGIDWGFNDPNVFLRTYIDTDRSIGYVIDGIYQNEWIPEDECGKSKYQQFAELVYRKTRDLPDDPIWSDAQGKSEASILKGEPWNLEIVFAPKQGANDRESGGRFLRSLNTIVLNDTLPKEIIDELISFEALPNPSGGWYDGKPGKRADHSFDCLRYAECQAIADGVAYTGDNVDEID